MSTSSISGSSSGWGLQSLQSKPHAFTKGQLGQLQEKLQSAGKDAPNLDKILDNFDQLDTNQDGTLSTDELQSGASQFGIERPKGMSGVFHGGPPPGFQMSSGTDLTSDTTNTLLQQILNQFSSSDPNTSDDSMFSSVDTAA